MKQSHLYIVIAILLGIIVFLIWPAPAETPEAVKIDLNREGANVNVSSDAVMITTTERTNEAETVVVSGTLVGYVAVSDSEAGEYTAALVNDGLEVLRVDIRELPDYTPDTPEAALGVEVNRVVSLAGYLKDGVFVATEVQ